MSAVSTELAQRYAQALRSHDADAGEAALQEAYELGREAMASGLGLLDLARFFHETLSGLLTADMAPADRRAQLVRAAGFLSESLVPFEMAQRGYRETITQLRTALDAIERERATLEAIMQSMSDGLLVVDAAGEIRYCNAQAGVLLKLDCQQLIGSDVGAARDAICTASSTPERVHVAWDDAQSKLETRPDFEVEVNGPPRRQVLVQLFPVHAGGGAESGTGVLFRDVTSDRELARTKDELVAVVSHELRTPLASLVGFSELLLMREFPDPQRRSYLGIMAQEGRRLTSLINDFLDLQRMESGRQRMSLAPLDVSAVLQRAVEAAGDDPHSPIRLDVPASLPQVFADGERIQQVLTNLLSNARKYSRGGEVHLSARATDMNVEIEVRDRGLGIPAEAVPQLFEKFFRVDNSDRWTIKGTGLGLAICKQIVEAHGGRIWAQSDGLGLGSCFAFTLPIVHGLSGVGELLIVEDDTSFSRLLIAELVASGHSVVRAATAEAALAQIDVVQPRVILLDLALPGMDGREFLQQLRVGGTDVPVVVITVSGLDANVRAALERLGVVTILAKEPGVAAAATAAVERVLKERAPRAGEAVG